MAEGYGLSEFQQFFLGVLAGRIAPGFRSLDSGARARFYEIVGGALASKPASLRRQFFLFLRVVRWWPLLRFGGRFDRLEPGRQDAALRWFQDLAPVPLRMGFWGLKALVYLGTYGQPEVGERLSYRPVRNGNERLLDR